MTEVKEPEDFGPETTKKREKSKPEKRKEAKTRDDVVRDLSELVSGLRPDDPVTLVSPPFSVRLDENMWRGVVSPTTEAAATRRRAMLAQINAVLELDARAKAEDKNLAQIAKEEHDRYARTWENAIVELTGQNRTTEEAVRAFTLFIKNLQTSKSRYRGKIHTINASPEEITTETGLRMLDQRLSDYVNRPDPRQGRLFVVVSGWVGDTSRLHKLARVLDENRCMLISDGPSFDNLEKLQIAAQEGGLLEDCGGTKPFLRHTVLLGNRGRARARFKGKTAEEAEDLWIPLSGPWFGMYLDHIAEGKQWLPPTGFKNDLMEVDDVELDLLLHETDGHDLYLRHHVNPAIPRSKGSDKIIIWGADTLSKAGRGLQIGPAVVEMLVVRYAEWILNKDGMFDAPLPEARRAVQEKLSRFITKNTGPDLMFKMGSRAVVAADHENSKLIVDFFLDVQKLAMRAEIRLNKPQERGVGELEKLEMM